MNDYRIPLAVLVGSFLGSAVGTFLAFVATIFISMAMR